MCNENDHRLVHLDTKKYRESQGFNDKFTRIDRFYCEKCGEIITKRKEGYARYENELDWY